MPRVLEHTHFYWLTVALVGMLIAGALSREAPDSLTLSLIEYSSVFLLLLSLLSLTGERKYLDYVVKLFQQFKYSYVYGTLESEQHSEWLVLRSTYGRAEDL